MNLKKSWVNIPLLKNTIKQNALLAKVSLVVVCIFSIVGSLNSSAAIIAIAAFGLSCVLLTTCYAGFVQKYMTHKTEAGFIASLPIDSFSLWLTQYIAGLVLLVGTMFIESICIAMMSVLFFKMNISPIVFVFTTIFLAIYYYTISFFVSCMAGNRLGQFVYTVIFYALPLLLYIGIEMLAVTLVPYDKGFVSHDLLYLVVPLASGLECLGGGPWRYLMGHVIILFSFLVGGYYVFKFRSIENTGSALLNKKANFFLKIIVIIALTLSAYMIITQMITIIPNYTFSNIIKAGIIFIILGILLALMLEILFHSVHIYRSLVYYVPALLLCFVGCYIYGNYQYQELVNTMYKSNQVNLVYYVNVYDEQENSTTRAEALISMDGKLAQKLVRAIDRKDLLSSSTLSNIANPMEMNFYFNVKEDYDLTIYVSQDVLKEILAKDEKILHAVANSYYDLDTSELKGLNSLFITGNKFDDSQSNEDLYNVRSILDASQIATLIEYIDTKQYMRVNTMFDATYRAVYPKGYFTLLNGDTFMNALIFDEKALERAKRFKQCIQIINELDTETIDKWKKTYANIFTSDHFYILNWEESDSVEIIDDQTIAIDILFSLETQENEPAGVVNAKCIFTWQEDSMVLTNIEKVGDK